MAQKQPLLPDLRLVPGADADCVRAARLISDAFYVHDMMDHDRVSPERLREELGETGDVIEAWLAGDFIGAAILVPAQDVIREIERPVLQLHGPGLYFGLAGVKRDFMRRGVGRRILAFAEDTARDRAYPRLLLSALREMGNVDYYLQHGYTVRHHWDYDRDGASYRFAIMGKELT